MANVTQFTSNLGTVDFDFDNRKVVFGRYGSFSETFHLVSMEINFADITDIEVRPPKFLAAPAFCLIVNGKRLMTDNNNNATQFILNKADYQKALSVLEQVVKTCGLSGIKDYERAGVPKEVYVPADTSAKKQEHRIKCNACGKVFCYTDEDLRRNWDLNDRAQTANNMAISEALGGTRLMAHKQMDKADSLRGQIVDYSKCPHCNSRDLRELSADEWKQHNAYQTGNAAPSVADELKKYKELLDMGVITQAEFDAKKKQLLGL